MDGQRPLTSGVKEHPSSMGVSPRTGGGGALGHTGAPEAPSQSVSSDARPDWHLPACLLASSAHRALHILPLSLAEGGCGMATFPGSLLPQVSRIRVRQHLETVGLQCSVDWTGAQFWGKRRFDGQTQAQGGAVTGGRGGHREVNVLKSGRDLGKRKSFLGRMSRSAHGRGSDECVCCAPQLCRIKQRICSRLCVCHTVRLV